MTTGINNLYDLYVLEGLEFALNQCDEFDYNANYLRPRVAESKAILVSNLAIKLRDYLFCASVAEARHASRVCDMQIEGLDRGNYSRGSAAELATQYDFADSINVLSELFNDHRWDSAYGGRAWGKIIDFCGSYGKWDDLFFIDHIVDIEHNGGRLFDKTEVGAVCEFNVRFNEAEVRRFLDLKAAYNMAFTAGPHWVYIAHSVYKLVSSFCTAHETEFQPCNAYGNEYGYGNESALSEPLEYGNIKMVLDNVHPYTCCVCGESLDEDDTVFRYDKWGDVANTYCGYHAMQNLFTCYDCGELHNNDNAIIGDDGYSYCESCADNYEKCIHCGVPIIDGQSVSVTTDGIEGNEYVCNDCLRSQYAKCAVCGYAYVTSNTEHDIANVCCDTCMETLEAMHESNNKAQ